MILTQIRAQKELWRFILKHFRPRKGSKKAPKRLKIIENHAFLAFWRPLGDPQTLFFHFGKAAKHVVWGSPKGLQKAKKA
jgi:hypothetical protein